MEDIRSVLNNHSNKIFPDSDSAINQPNKEIPTTSDIPDVFFDDVLLKYKLTRVEILLIMSLYRNTWCKPNLYKKHGISPLISLEELGDSLEISGNILHQSLRKLETFGFIETIRSGQFFVRRYFTEELDRKFNQSYDNFL
jgi:DNA-binding MarR family transcriptional regulator